MKHALKINRVFIFLVLLLCVQQSYATSIYQLETIDTNVVHMNGYIVTNGAIGDNLLFNSSLVAGWNIEVTLTSPSETTTVNFNSLNSSFSNGSAVIDVTINTIKLDLSSFLQSDFDNGWTQINGVDSFIRWQNPVEITDPGFEEITPPSMQFLIGGVVTAVHLPRGDIIATSVAPVPVPAAVWLFSTGLIGLFGMARRKACV